MLQNSSVVDSPMWTGNPASARVRLHVASRFARAAICALVTAAVLAVASPSALAEEESAASTNPRLTEAAALYDLWAGEQLAYNGIPGVVVGVVSRNGLVWSKGYGTTDLAGGIPLTPSTRFRIGSVSKVFTATAILQLRDAGKLRLDDPVVRHLPWFKVPNPFPTAPPITIEHLLTHTSGLSRESPFAAWTTHEFPTREELRAAMPRVTVISPPGKTYRYSNLGVALLGEVVAAASGESWASYVKQHITAPLGMNSTTGAPTAAEVAALPRQHRRKQPDGSRGTLAYYDTGAIAPAAAIVSTLEDLARFAAFELTADPAGPPAGGAQVLSGPTLAEMHRPHFVNTKWTGGRGLGWGVSRRDGHTYVSHGGWIGGHRADVILDPDRGLAAVALTNADDASPGFFARQALAVVGGAVATPGAGHSAAPAPP
ncbi:MAG TPA: serine hydrolase domain-containing protein, partial [Thermoanaerobaculia bacterium]|nr:serine hydrolase domain-containing protein [Thermoanaerobaculia bacterium]